MRILPAQNFNLQNKKQKSFKGINHQISSVTKQITDVMVNSYQVTKRINEGRFDFKPATEKIFYGMSEFKVGNLNDCAPLNDYTDFYNVFFASLIRQKSPLLTSKKAMNKFCTQVWSITEEAENRNDIDSAKKSLLLLQRVYNFLKTKKMYTGQEPIFKSINKQLADLE